MSNMDANLKKVYSGKVRNLVGSEKKKSIFGKLRKRLAKSPSTLKDYLPKSGR
jgi:hypothetical protein